MIVTGDTKLSNAEIVEFDHTSQQRGYIVGTKEWVRAQNTRDMAIHLAIAEKVNFPDKTIYEFLSGIAESTSNMQDEWIDTAGVITLEDVLDIIDDEDNLGIVDMLIHTFDMEHMASYVIVKFGRH